MCYNAKIMLNYPRGKLEPKKKHKFQHSANSNLFKFTATNTTLHATGNADRLDDLEFYKATMH
jgi:hypothetical protein